MGFPKYYEDIVEARRENGAGIVYEYQYPQENPRRLARVETPREPAPFRLTLYDKLSMPAFILNLESDSEPVSIELLKRTLHWTPAHFNELAQRSPRASARLNMAYRGYFVKHCAPEPSYRVPGPRKPFIFEIRKRQRPDTLHLPSYS